MPLSHPPCLTWSGLAQSSPCPCLASTTVTSVLLPPSFAYLLAFAADVCLLPWAHPFLTFLLMLTPASYLSFNYTDANAIVICPLPCTLFYNKAVTVVMCLFPQQNLLYPLFSLWMPLSMMINCILNYNVPLSVPQTRLSFFCTKEVQQRPEP
jgi:hypothetical protein